MNKYLLIILLIATPTSITASSDAKDFEFWTKVNIIKEINDKTDLVISTGHRWNDYASQAYYHFGEVGIGYHFHPNWIVIPSYRQSYTRIDNHWEQEENPRLTLTGTWKGHCLQYSHRSRFEYQSDEKFFVYRNKSRIDFIGLLCEEITPFIYEEFFLSHMTDLSQNRACIGLKSNWYARIQNEVGYFFLLRKESTTWFGYHVLMCYFDIYF